MTSWYMVFTLVMHLHGAAAMPKIDVRVPMLSEQDCANHLALATKLAEKENVPAPQCWPIGE